jgi:hypothetical protein
MYTKRAVIYSEDVPFVTCECGNKLLLPPSTEESETKCKCGLRYDERGYILNRKRKG